ncbi:hypothetical protein ACWCV5_27985 [Streptomyces tubercidicus]
MANLAEPFVLRYFLTLSPDGLARVWDGATLDLADNATGAGPYETLWLTDGLELHHRPAASDVNAVATAFAARFGYTETIRGAVAFTGESDETDTAPGMTDETFCNLNMSLGDVTREGRLRYHYLPSDTVMVRPSDYAPGDTLWAAGGPSFPMRADQAPPGYWQRTGGQFLP